MLISDRSRRGVWGGGQAFKGSPNGGWGIQEESPGGHGPWQLLNFKHLYRWNHAIHASSQQKLLEKLKLKLAASGGGSSPPPCAMPGSSTDNNNKTYMNFSTYLDIKISIKSTVKVN